MNVPKNITAYTVTWDNVGDVDETMKVHWINPDQSSQFQAFIVGEDCFLESPVNMIQVPSLQLLMSIRMAAILANALPGTQEYIDAMSQVVDSGARYFQTIIGDAQLKTIVAVDDLQYGPKGTVFDLTFNKKGALSNVMTVRADVWSLSQYQDGNNALPNSVMCVPGAIHKALGFKKSQLGAVDSANRVAVESFVVNQKFWI